MTAPASVWPNHCDDDCPCRLEESRCVIRCACGICEIGSCGYCDVAVGKSSRGPRNLMGTKDEDAKRLDAARERGKAESSAQIDAARDAFLAQPPSKPKQRRRTQKEMAALRAERYQRADATPDTELHPALLDDPLPPLPFELDDLQSEILGTLEEENAS